MHNRKSSNDKKKKKKNQMYIGIRLEWIRLQFAWDGLTSSVIRQQKTFFSL